MSKHHSDVLDYAIVGAGMSGLWAAFDELTLDPPSEPEVSVDFEIEDGTAIGESLARGLLDVDYRGSAGYGNDFRTRLQYHLGGLDLYPASATHTDS